jgi:hypothetical protein
MTWIMICCYIGSVIYDFILLRSFETSSKTSITDIQKIAWLNQMTPWINFSYLFTFFTLILLLPYVYSMTGILSPEILIKKLAKNIPKLVKRKKLLSYIKTNIFQMKPFINDTRKALTIFQYLRTPTRIAQKDKDYWEKNDPFQPIDDLICISMTRYDIRTSIIGLDEMQKKVLDTVKKHSKDSVFIVYHYCVHLDRLGKLFVTKDEEKLVQKIAINLRELGLELVKNKCSIHTDVIPVLGNIGSLATEKDMWKVGKYTFDAIIDVGQAFQYTDAEIANKIAVHLSRIGKKIVEKYTDRKYVIVREIADGYEKIGNIFLMDGFYLATKIIAQSLGEIINETIKAGYSGILEEDTVKNHVVNLLKTFANKSIAHNNRDAFDSAVYSLWTIGILSETRGLSEIRYSAAEALSELSKKNSIAVLSNLGIVQVLEIDLMKNTKAFEKFMKIYNEYCSELKKKEKTKKSKN